MIIFRCVSVKLALEILRVCLESFPRERFSVSKLVGGYIGSNFLLSVEKKDDALALEIEERIASSLCSVKEMEQKISDMEAEMLEEHIGEGEGKGY